MLRIENQNLVVVGQFGGEDESVFQRNGRLLVEVQHANYNRLPTLYSWGGTAFVKADHDFPSFYEKLARSEYEPAILGRTPVPPETMVMACRLALKAYRLARQPQMGRKACMAAMRRISSGTAIARGSTHESPVAFEQEKLAAVDQIRALLVRHYSPR